jgi:hypothetical protein
MVEDVALMAFYLNRVGGFGYSIEPVPETPDRFGHSEHIAETYPTREAALDAYINELEAVKSDLMVAIKAAKKKQRRWDHRTARREG